MTQPTEPKRKTDELLADFADRVLKGKTAVLAASSDEELRGLEDTVVRLHQGLPNGAMDAKVRKRLIQDFKTHMRDTAPTQSVWRSRQSRQRMILTFAAIIVLAAIFLLSPFLNTGAGSVQATAGLQSPGVLILIGLAVIAGLAIWLGRRK